MAMLAAPRRKQKVINLRAKNNAWSNDSTKFGQRMLEKMGWSEGKGLGANENGIVEHIVARYKNDDRGLGFEDRNDQWTKHEDDFNSLLANLSNGDKKEEKLHSGVSLEVKSKKSKARVHYHKFTRGKDLTRYSEKDLANIFGKKSLKNEEKKEDIIEKEEDIKTTEQVFTDKGSMVDYFKSKFASFKSKNKYSFNDNSNEDDRGDFAFRGFSGTGNDNKDGESNTDIAFQGFSFYNSEEKVDKENSVVESEVNVENTKKSKKKKKNKNRDSEPAIIENNTSENIANDEDISESLPENTEKVKKSKKNKYKDALEISVEVQDEEVETKKSKKKKRVIETVEEHNAEDYVPKKKKKRKNKESNDE